MQMRTQKGHEQSVKSSIKSGGGETLRGRAESVEESAQPRPGLFVPTSTTVFVVCPPVCGCRSVFPALCSREGFISILIHAYS